MRRIQRRQLSERARQMLAKRAQRVTEASHSQAEVTKSWRSKNSLSWDDIRATLRDMSTGLGRCMYCEDSRGTDIEHFYPKSRYPERAYEWTNYLLACTTCNSNDKRDQFPVDGDRSLLIDPTSQDPAEYLEFSPTTGEWRARGGCREGRESIRVFGLARHSQARRDAWELFQLALLKYGNYRATGRIERARDLTGVMRRMPFSGVFAALLRFSADPRARRYLDERVLTVLTEYPELRELFE